MAPGHVRFFSVDGHSLNNKGTLERQIRKITGIAVKALQRDVLLNLSVNERLSWAESRITKREENKAY